MSQKLSRKDAVKRFLGILADRVPQLAPAAQSSTTNDWSTLLAQVGNALNTPLNATGDTVACFYTVDNQSVCAVMTVAECQRLGGDFTPGVTTCPP
jgi:hypothetical protein